MDFALLKVPSQYVRVIVHNAAQSLWKAVLEVSFVYIPILHGQLSVPVHFFQSPLSLVVLSLSTRALVRLLWVMKQIQIV